MPITKHVEYKILLFVYKALEGTGPEYIHELLTVEEGVQDLKSVHNVVCLNELERILSKVVTEVWKKAATCLWNCTHESLKNTDSL